MFHAAGSAGQSIAKVATDESARSGRALWSIGVDVDEGSLVGAADRAHVLTSMVTRHDLAIVEAVRRFRAGTLPAGPVEFALADGSMELAHSGDHLDASTLTRITQLRDALTSGTITVPAVPTQGPNVVTPADVTMTLRSDGRTCSTPSSPAISMPEGVVFRVDIDNDSPTAMVAAIPYFTAPTSDDLADAYPYDFVTVAPHGTQILTARSSPGRYTLTCTVDGHTTVASKFEVTD